MTDRSGHVEKLKALITERDAEMDMLQAKADARIKLDHAIEDLKKHRKAAAETATGAHEASEDARADLKDGFETAMHKLLDALSFAKDRVS